MSVRQHEICKLIVAVSVVFRVVTCYLYHVSEARSSRQKHGNSVTLQWTYRRLASHRETRVLITIIITVTTTAMKTRVNRVQLPINMIQQRCQITSIESAAFTAKRLPAKIDRPGADPAIGGPGGRLPLRACLCSQHMSDLKAEMHQIRFRLTLLGERSPSSPS